MENIVESNKLIAEFMGLIVFKESEIINWEDLNTTVHSISEYQRYHTSWDWLMPVVEKIESIQWGGNETLYTWTENPFQIRIQGHNVGIILDGVGDNSKVKDTKHYGFYDVDWRNCKTKIELVYLTCVSFIKWYDEQNKQS